jgi:hypothetical protein
MQSSGKLRSVILARTDFADSCHRDDGSDTFHRKSVLTRATRRIIPEDGILHCFFYFSRKYFRLFLPVASFLPVYILLIKEWRQNIPPKRR